MGRPKSPGNTTDETAGPLERKYKAQKAERMKKFLERTWYE